MSSYFIRGATALLGVCVLLVAPVAAQKRTALVIGNSSYLHTSPLANPKNDAGDVTLALKKVGFTVIEGRDLDKGAMDRTIHQFARELNGSQVGLFFYAGHGLQVDGQNYLVPVDAKLEDASGLDFEMVRLELVHRTMERATKTNLIFLDACRDNPLSRNLARALGTRSTAIGKGLASVESGEGTLLSFSTQPGSVAADGAGRNSPYAAAFVKQLETSKDDLSAMLINVRRQVIQDTGRRQVPWEHSALTARFYFSEPESVPAGPGRAGPQSGMTFEQQAELALWNAVKDADNAAVVQSYLNRFPNGLFAAPARLMIDKLNREAQHAAVSAEKDAELRKAEEAKRVAEIAKAESERKAAAAKQAEDLRRAQDEARKSREALAKAEVEREAARKSAEDARKAAAAATAEREAAAKVAEQTRVASLPPAQTEAGQSSVAEQDRLVMNIQAQLVRVGCHSGAIDGKWNEATRDSLAKFAKQAKLSTPTEAPNPDVLEALKSKLARVCPLVCKAGLIEANGQCIARAPPRKPVAESPRSSSEPSSSGPSSACIQWRRCASLSGGANTGQCGAAPTNCSR